MQWVTPLLRLWASPASFCCLYLHHTKRFFRWWCDWKVSGIQVRVKIGRVTKQRNQAAHNAQGRTMVMFWGVATQLLLWCCPASILCLRFRDWLASGRLGRGLPSAYYFYTFAVGVNWSWAGDSCVYSFLPLTTKWKQNRSQCRSCISYCLTEAVIPSSCVTDKTCSNKINCGYVTWPRRLTE